MPRLGRDVVWVIAAYGRMRALPWAISPLYLPANPSHRVMNMVHEQGKEQELPERPVLLKATYTILHGCRWSSLPRQSRPGTPKFGKTRAVHLTGQGRSTRSWPLGKASEHVIAAKVSFFATILVRGPEGGTGTNCENYPIE